LPLPLFRTFTYRVPDGLTGSVTPGSRVVVPFRNRKEIGIVVGEGAARDAMKVKDVIAAPDAAPVMDEPMLALCRWIAEYYITPLGVALRTALPAALTGVDVPVPARKTRRVAQIALELPTLMRRDNIFGRAPQQRALYELLETLGGRAPVEHLAEQLHFSTSVLKGLVARGLVEIGFETVERDPFLTRAQRAPETHVPSDAQAHALERLAVAPPGHVALLHGVTGSGKTLVYLDFLEQVVIGQGKSAIVLVPEIALTPQTVDRFRAVFGNRIAVLHSGLSDGERYDAWLALRRGEKRIAVGARSAIFAPLQDLGAIVVDEEHESSYKQGEAPRYHAREVATVRARAEGAVVVLGSATPSLESWSNAASGKYELLTLPDRAGGAQLPKVRVIDLRADQPKRMPGEVPEVDASFSYAIGPALETALHDRLAKREQSILLLNRRGYSSFIQCGTCGDVAVCPNCSISLTHHRTPQRLVCHYCQHSEPLHLSCNRCGGLRLRQRGLGTQQVERLLAERYPTARIARMDVDTTSGKWAHTEILDRVGAGEVDILLGTQMIAKGLDFPNVTLVGVIDADVGINLPDFRASERCYQLLSQVAGRAGRGPKGGEVLIQTRAPSHHAVQCAVTHDYHAFVTQELAGRKVPAYPPNVRIANVVLSGTQEDATARLAMRTAAWLHSLLAARPAPGVTVIGPAPCPVERIKQRWRWHVLIKAERPQELGRVARYLTERFEIPKQFGLRMTVDRDPVALL
ncbi:MAG: primosomal protein N', partial [Gemmatimonadota bacterium]|nr:primosomal protein N' [Gemmatimonadota bacterium]